MVSGKQSLVALGANVNLGDLSLEATILAAIAGFDGEGLEVAAASRLYETPCFPAGAGPDYINAAVMVTPRHLCSPAEFLAKLHRIESRFGRERLQRWGSRTLDLDLLAIGDLVAPDAATARHWMDLPAEDQTRLAPDQLILPHPRLQDRAFVLVPLADIAPDWRHPLLHKTVAEMLADLPDAARSEVILRRPAASV